MMALHFISWEVFTADEWVEVFSGSDSFENWYKIQLFRDYVSITSPDSRGRESIRNIEYQLSSHTADYPKDFATLTSMPASTLTEMGL